MALPRDLFQHMQCLVPLRRIPPLYLAHRDFAQWTRENLVFWRGLPPAKMSEVARLFPDTSACQSLVIQAVYKLPLYWAMSIPVANAFLTRLWLAHVRHYHTIRLDLLGRLRTPEFAEAIRARRQRYGRLYVYEVLPPCVQEMLASVDGGYVTLSCMHRDLAVFSRQHCIDLAIDDMTMDDVQWIAALPPANEFTITHLKSLVNPDILRSLGARLDPYLYIYVDVDTALQPLVDVLLLRVELECVTFYVRGLPGNGTAFTEHVIRNFPSSSVVLATTDTEFYVQAGAFRYMIC